MKFKKKLFANIGYTGKMIVLMWQNDKMYLFYMLLDIIAYSSLPFVSMYLVQQSIQMLETGAEFRLYAPVVLGFIAAYCIIGCLHNYLNYKRDLHANVISFRLYQNLFEKTLSIDYEMLLDKDIQEKKELAHKIIVNNQFSQIVNNFHNFISKVIVLVGLIAVLSQIDFWILIITLAIVMVNTAVARYRNKFRRAIDVDLNPLQRRVMYFFNIGSSFSFIKEIKTYKMEKELLSRYSAIQGDICKGLDKTIHLSLAGYIIANVMNLLLDGVAYTYLGFRVLVSKTMSIANFSMFLNAIYNFNSAVGTIIGTFENMSANGRYLQDYFDFMALKTMRDKAGDELRALPESKSYSFAFDNVSYRYPHQENYALRNVSFVIRPNEKIAIVGENGAGKTTLTLLLMRMVEPTEGKILLNGVDIREYDESEYRNLFSTVFQDYKLFSFTIQDNVTALGDVNVSRMESAINRSGIRKKISALDKGVHTYIDKLYDNDGVVLSGGESQRLAIARALYKDAPIYVLDEPTAALDPRMENEIYMKFRDITEEKTTFYITHRLASTHFCDRIIVLKDGKIEEIGSHSELMDCGGYYAELYNMQAQYYVENPDDEAEADGCEK